MSIKDQLRAAILSGGAKAAMPAANNVDFTEGTYVAPADGYVCFSVRSTFVNQWLSADATPIQSVQAISSAGQNPCVFVPVRAGQTVTLASDSAAVVNFRRFIKLVGGAKSLVAQLFWRVVPCLRNCLTRALTPIADRIEACSTLIGGYKSEGGQFSISRMCRPLTVGCFWQELRGCATSLPCYPAFKVRRAKRHLETRGAPRGFEFAKDRNTRCGRMPARMRSLCSIPTSAHNLCFGGASYE